MAATGHKGVDVRESATRLVFDAFLLDSVGAIVTSGTTSLYLYEVQDDGTLKSYDWNDNTFKATALTTETVSMTHRQGNNATTNTGLWTYRLSTVSGFTAGAVYYARVVNSNASPTSQITKFQFGGAEGDVSVSTGRVVSDVGAISGDSAAADNLEAAADGTGYNLGGGAVVAASVTGAVGSVTGNVGGNVTGSVGSVASFGSLVSDIATAVWAFATRTLSAFGFTVDTNANATETAIQAKTDNLPTDPADQSAVELAITTAVNALNDLSAADVRTAVGLASANLDTQLDALPTAAEIVTALSNLNIDGKTWLAIQRVIAGRLAAKTSGLVNGYGTYVIRDAADLIDLLTIVVDADGNVTSVTWGI